MDEVLRNALILSAFFNIGVVFSYNVEVNLSHNGPVVLGANITFTAELIDSTNQPPSGDFAFEWKDNAYPEHRYDMMKTKNTTVQWNISYPSKRYSAREYIVSVKVFIREFVYIQMAHQSIRFNVTETLNGKIDIEQEDLNDKSVFVSNASPVKHTIKLTDPDHNFIVNHATNVLTFWFVNCVYYGFSTDYSFAFNYTEEKSYNIEALVVASFDEPSATPPPTTTTRTPATTTTTTAATTTTTTAATTTSTADTSTTMLTTPAAVLATSSTTPATTTTAVNLVNATSATHNDTSFVGSPDAAHGPAIQVSSVVTLIANSKSPTAAVQSSDSKESSSTDTGGVSVVLSRMISNEAVLLQKRHVEESATLSLNATRDINFLNNNLSYTCLNSTFIPTDPNKTYGYFQKKITSKAPISKVAVKGNNWLQFGDVLNLNITCNGSAKFQHCSKIKIGVHNVTGDETCSAPLEGDVCDFSLTHYFREANTYTYVIIIMNDVSKVVTPAVIRMYKVTVQPQLSVIVVPVTCSLLAIIIIVFGVAYYVQSQNRYTVEVADFDFGQANDMEYKSFYERLREDISNMFSRSGDFLDQPEAVPRRSKYDNMVES